MIGKKFSSNHDICQSSVLCNTYKRMRLNSQNYMNLLFAAGYLQCVLKATRIQNASKTLIDHIHCNSISNHFRTGVFISDISDHFFTFICTSSASPKLNKTKMTVSRDFSAANLNNFKHGLGLAD